MALKTVTIPINCLIDMLKQLNDKEKNEIFEKVFFDTENQPLSRSERESIARAEEELERGETIPWPIGE